MIAKFKKKYIFLHMDMIKKRYEILFQPSTYLYDIIMLEQSFIKYAATICIW